MELHETAAGVPSVKQSISHEPSFTRKRRLHETDSQIISEGVLRHKGESTSTVNKVCLHKELHKDLPTSCALCVPVCFVE